MLLQVIFSRGVNISERSPIINHFLFEKFFDLTPKDDFFLCRIFGAADFLSIRVRAFFNRCPKTGQITEKRGKDYACSSGLKMHHFRAKILHFLQNRTCRVLHLRLYENA